MKVHDDKEVDFLNLERSDKKPDGVIEIAEGLNVDTTKDGKLSGIEIINASPKIDLNTILTYSIELDKNTILQNVA